MTPISQRSPGQTLDVRADGTATRRWRDRKYRHKRYWEELPAGQVTLRECDYTRMLDAIEAGLPPTPGWTRSRVHWDGHPPREQRSGRWVVCGPPPGLGILSLKRGKVAINIMVTDKLDGITIGGRHGGRAMAGWEFEITDKEGVNERIRKLTREAEPQ